MQIPRPLWERLKTWIHDIHNGQIILNICDGQIVSYRLIESGNVKELDIDGEESAMVLTKKKFSIQ